MSDEHCRVVNLRRLGNEEGAAKLSLSSTDHIKQMRGEARHPPCPITAHCRLLMPPSTDGLTFPRPVRN